MLLGLERVRVELEHLLVRVEDVQQEDGGIKSADRSRVSADKLESRREGRRVSGADQAGASRGEPQRRGLSTWEGRGAARWRRRTQLAEGHRAGKGRVRDGASPSRVRRGRKVRRGDAQNGANGAGCAEACCRRVPGRGGGAGWGWGAWRVVGRHQVFVVGWNEDRVSVTGLAPD